MIEHKKYHKIGQFRNVIKDIEHYYGEVVLPTLKFTGTVKVHGTNASVVITKVGLQYPQSKSRHLTIEDDNYGFARWHYDNFASFARLYRLIGVVDEDVVIYGEWAGKGIQKGVAVSDIDRFFYVFGVKVIYNDRSFRWLKDISFVSDINNAIINSRQILELNIDIDFIRPKDAQNELIAITNKIEANCPVGEFLGVKGVGEGVVWEHITDKGDMFCFKVKGDKHSVSKVKTLANVDTEKLSSIRLFVDYAVTENRLSQAFDVVCSNNPDRNILGEFIKWVSDDVRNEEHDVMIDNGLVMRDIGGALSKRAKNWFFDKELKEL